MVALGITLDDEALRSRQRGQVDDPSAGSIHRTEARRRPEDQISLAGHIATVLAKAGAHDQIIEAIAVDIASRRHGIA